MYVADKELGTEVVLAAQIPFWTPHFADVLLSEHLELATLVDVVRMIFDLLDEVNPIFDDSSSLWRVDHRFLRPVPHIAVPLKTSMRMFRGVLGKVELSWQRTRATLNLRVAQ